MHLKERFDYINALYADHTEDIKRVQEEALDVLVPQLVNELSSNFVDDQPGYGGLSALQDRISAFLDDPVTIYRFLRKAHFDETLTLELLRRTLCWRITTAVDLVSPLSLDPIYTQRPVFYLHPQIHDALGRPAAILNLRNVNRTEDGTLDSLKEYFAHQLEVTRRYLADLSQKDPHGAPKVQIVLMLDLADANLSNLEIELLPYIVDLLKHHFPGMVGAIYVLNYGWAYAGMWQVAKRVLPKVTLDRILFPAKDELFTKGFFHREHVLTDHGGSVAYKYSASNNYILTKYGRPSYYLRAHRPSSTLATPTASAAASPAHSRPISRNASFESLRSHSLDATFHSAQSTPRSSSSHLSVAKQGHSTNQHRHAPMWLDMTRVKHSSTSLNGSVMDRGRRSPRSASSSRNSSRKSSALARELTDVMRSGDAAPVADSIAQGGKDEAEEHDTSIAIAAHPLESTRSRQDSIEQLRRDLQHSVHENGLENGSAKHGRSGRTPGVMSPYNVNNPYYGYPAVRYVNSSTRWGDDQPSNSLPGYDPDVAAVPQIRPFHAKRRWRDLIRTLSYLAALRILALHRKLRWRFSLFIRIVWEKLVRGGAVSGSSSRTAEAACDKDDSGFSSTHISPVKSRKQQRSVRWASDDSSSRTFSQALIHRLAYLSPLPVFRYIPRWIYWIAALVFLRSAFFQTRARRQIDAVKAYFKHLYATHQALERVRPVMREVEKFLLG